MSDSSSPVGVPSSYLRQFSNSMLSWHWTHCSLWKSSSDAANTFLVFSLSSLPSAIRKVHRCFTQVLVPCFPLSPMCLTVRRWPSMPRLRNVRSLFRNSPQCQLFIFLISFKSVFGSDWFFEPLILPKLHLTSENMTSSFNKDAHRLFLSMLIFKDFLRVLSANFFLWWRPFILLYFYSSEHFFLIILFHL